MSWRYGIIKRVHEDGVTTYGLHELFDFTDTGYQTPGSWTEEPIAFGGHETVEDLLRSLKMAYDDCMRYENGPFDEVELLEIINDKNRLEEEA